jgi:hydrogenase nickel incorporation protein HypA/HybF
MHEASIAQGLLDAALSAVGDRRARITRITVVAGVLTAVSPECLSMYFEALARGTLAEGAALDVRSAPAKLICTKCAAEADYHAEGWFPLRCASCGGETRLRGGMDLFLESLEIDDEDQPAAPDSHGQ